MADSTGGNLGKAIEELVQRVVETTIASLHERGAESKGAEPSRAGNTSEADGGNPAAALSVSAVNRAVATILEGASQTDIMAAALRGAAGLGGRAALFVRRAEQFSLWRSEGFKAPAAKLRSIAVPADQPGIFHDLCEHPSTLCRASSAASLPASLEEALQFAPGAEVCLLPVIVQGKVISALYCDSAGGIGSDRISALEILTRVAGLALETVASRGAASQPGPQAAASADSPAAGGVETAPELAPLEKTEPLAAASAAGSFADTFAAPLESPLLAAPPKLESLPEQDRESHRKAYRFARVAVQDLLSYHKDKIELGRRDKNLFVVLKDDIEKTRENYQRRFGQTAAQSFDYLHYEMVAKLAGNDPSQLGEQYPGPWSGSVAPAPQQT